MKIEFSEQDPAIKYLKGILTVDQFNKFLNLAEQPELSLPIHEDRPIKFNGLPARVKQALVNADLTTVRKLAMCGMDSLYGRTRGVKKQLGYTPNLGAKSLKLLEEHLKTDGITFEMLDQIRFSS